MIRWVAVLLVYAGCLAATAMVAFYAALILIGPHGGILPRALNLPVGLLLWLVVLVFPVWLSRRASTAFARRDKSR